MECIGKAGATATDLSLFKEPVQGIYMKSKHHGQRSVSVQDPVQVIYMKSKHNGQIFLCSRNLYK